MILSHRHKNTTASSWTITALFHSLVERITTLPSYGLLFSSSCKISMKRQRLLFNSCTSVVFLFCKTLRCTTVYMLLFQRCSPQTLVTPGFPCDGSYAQAISIHIYQQTFKAIEMCFSELNPVAQLSCFSVLLSPHTDTVNVNMHLLQYIHHAVWLLEEVQMSSVSSWEWWTHLHALQ